VYGFARREFQLMLLRRMADFQPSLPAAPALRPWSCVVGDALASLPGAREIDPDVPTRWLVEVDQAGTTWQLWLVYGLLQAVRPASGC
jgi:hypothetical protein